MWESSDSNPSQSWVSFIVTAPHQNSKVHTFRDLKYILFRGQWRKGGGGSPTPQLPLHTSPSPISPSWWWWGGGVTTTTACLRVCPQNGRLFQPLRWMKFHWKKGESMDSISKEHPQPGTGLHCTNNTPVCMFLLLNMWWGAEGWQLSIFLWWQPLLCHSYALPGGSTPHPQHNTLDTPFLIIIFITLSARLSCLPEPLLCAPHGHHSWGWTESCASACSVVAHKEEKKSNRQILMTWCPPPPLQCQGLPKVHNTSCRVRGEAKEKTWFPGFCGRNAPILPRIGLINSPLIMSKLTHFYLISACGLRRSRAQIVFACAFNAAVTVKVAEEFL